LRCIHVFGASAYVLPVLLFCFGLSYFFQLMAYLHRRWVWAALLLFCCMGLLDLNNTVNSPRALATESQPISAGGWIGLMMNKYAFGHFGSVGATIIFVTLYLISLLFLTNFELGGWLRELWRREPACRGNDFRDEDKVLERRAKELERQAKKLQEQVIRPASAQTLAGAGTDGPRPERAGQTRISFQRTTRKFKPAEIEAEAPAGG